MTSCPKLMRYSRLALALGWGAGAFAAASSSTGAEIVSADEKPPHLILFLSDDHGVDDSGAYGDTVVRSPNIDQLAREGMRFTQAFAESPLCSPSRCVIATGLSPFRNGGHKFGTPLRPGLRTMPAYFNAAGYHTAHFGKFHHAPRKQFPYAVIHPDEKRAAAYLRDYAGDKPLLLVVCSHPPHTPWLKNSRYDQEKLNLPPTFIDTPQTRQDRANYYTDVSEMDRILGEVMAAVEQKGIADQTLFLYSSDQGANWPFGKWCLYDAGIRVPLIARWPGKIEKGAVSQTMVSLADLLPTMLEVAGGPVPADIDGRSFLKVLQDGSAAHRAVVFSAHTGNDNGGPGVANRCPTRSIRTPTHKLILNLYPERTFFTHIVGCKPDSKHHLPFWNSWVERAKSDPVAKAVVDRYLNRPALELYDLRQDPHEQNNLAGQPEQQVLLASLQQQLNAWRVKQGDPEIKEAKTQ